MPKNIDAQAIRQLAALLDETGLTEIEYSTGVSRIRVARSPAVQNVVAASAPAPAAPAVPAPAIALAAEANPATQPGAVKSPMVGTVYLSPEPGAASFVAVGDTVREGQTLLLVEAMKTFNEIKAPRAGVVRRILVESGKPVEYGEALMIVD